MAAVVLLLDGFIYIGHLEEVIGSKRAIRFYLDERQLDCRSGGNLLEAGGTVTEKMLLDYLQSNLGNHSFVLNLREVPSSGMT